MQVTLCNEKEEPIVIHNTNSSHEEQKITGTINQGINAIDSLEFNIYPVIRDMIRSRSIRHVLSALIR